MKTAGLIFLMLVAVVASAQTNQGWQVGRYPVRVFGRATANLTPLFQWWTLQPVHTNGLAYTSATIDPDTNAIPEGDRPLSAWHLVTGTHAGTIGSSWAVEAVIYTSPTARTNARIILKHPPVVEEQNFYALPAQLAQINEQIAAAKRAYDAAVKAEQQNQESVNNYRRSILAYDRISADNYARRAVEKQQEATPAASLQQQLEATRDQTEQQLKAIPAVGGVYHIEWFAMMLGRNKAGLPIYDLGLVSPNPP
jgi:hypothetical protein